MSSVRFTWPLNCRLPPDFCEQDATKRPRQQEYFLISDNLSHSSPRFSPPPIPEMETKAYEFDPDGDIILVLRNPHPDFAVWDES